MYSHVTKRQSRQTETPCSLVERWARLELQLLCPTLSTSTERDAPIERPNLTRTLAYASRIGCLERRLWRRSFKGLTSKQINSPDNFTTSKSDTYFSTLNIPTVTTYHHAFILYTSRKKTNTKCTIWKPSASTVSAQMMAIHLHRQCDVFRPTSM